MDLLRIEIMFKLLSLLTVFAIVIAVGSLTTRAYSRAAADTRTTQEQECAALLKRLSRPLYDTWQNRMRAWSCQAARGGASSEF